MGHLSQDLSADEKSCLEDITYFNGSGSVTMWQNWGFNPDFQINIQSLISPINAHSLDNFKLK